MTKPEEATIAENDIRLTTTEQFVKDVDEGLSRNPKSLPSKYFYDAKGDDLFVQIMKLPEYYLTRAEFEIFSQKTADIVDALGLEKGAYFELIELGAGDGTKTLELLQYLVGGSYQFDYLPVDISSNAIEGLESSLRDKLPELNVKGKQGDYFEVLSSLQHSHHPKVVLFMGSNLGNMNDAVAASFLQKLSDNLKKGDRLLLGVDMIKAAHIVLPAYNDQQGITGAFNLNLLDRINRELGGDFDLSKFKHSPEYSEMEGIAKSFIESTASQEVVISMMNKSFTFDKGEKIQTEISRKYNDEIIENLLQNTSFCVIDKLMDGKHLFADYILGYNESFVEKGE